MDLRKAESRDKETILKIVNCLHLDMPNFVWGQNDFVARQIERGEYFVAEIGQKIIGVFSLRQRAKKMFIETLAIDKDYRRQGIGTEVVEFAKNYTKENGLDALCACAFCEYNSADFYLNLGFSLSDHLGDYDKHKYYQFELKIKDQ